MEKVFTFGLNLDWSLLDLLSRIDRFDASWTSLEKTEGQSLKHLKSIATVRSVGASTRIEGSKMTDDEVDVLLKNIQISKLEDRYSQEVVGYFEVLDMIAGSYPDIEISESSVKNLHNIMLKHSTKDEWHRGNYKQHSNVVEAAMPDGSKQLIFKTTDPGFATEDAMSALIEWYNKDTTTHALVKNAVFTYEFLSIHPFQDGNGRLSRLISILLLLKRGYQWIQYVSLEHEIENRKNEYYHELRTCQSERPGENVTSWVHFFLNTLLSIQRQLMQKLETHGTSAQLAPREKSILVFIQNHPGCKSGEISIKLGIPLPTIKRILAELVSNSLIEKHGAGRGTTYVIS